MTHLQRMFVLVYAAGAIGLALVELAAYTVRASKAAM